MPNKLLFVSFYTEDYKEPALKLQKKLKGFGRRSLIKKIEDTGSWKKNIRRKPTIILELLEAATHYDAVVWLDADAILLKDPVLFDTITEDLAFYFYPRKAAGDTEPLGGTMFFRNTRAVKEFVKRWAKAVVKTPMHMKRPDQQFMRTMLPKSGLSVYKLPYSYSRLWTDKSFKGAVIRHQRWSMNFDNPKVTKLDKLEKEERHRLLANKRSSDRAEREDRAWYPLDEARLLGKEAVHKLKERMKRETAIRKQHRIDVRRQKYLKRIGKI